MRCSSIQPLCSLYFAEKKLTSSLVTTHFKQFELSNKMRCNLAFNHFVLCILQNKRFTSSLVTPFETFLKILLNEPSMLNSMVFLKWFFLKCPRQFSTLMQQNPCILHNFDYETSLYITPFWEKKICDGQSNKKFVKTLEPTQYLSHYTLKYEKNWGEGNNVSELHVGDLSFECTDLSIGKIGPRTFGFATLRIGDAFWCYIKFRGTPRSRDFDL